MCMLGELVKSEYEFREDSNPIIGYRGWNLYSNDGLLHPLNQLVEVGLKPNEVSSFSNDLDKFDNGEAGFYAYNYNYYYNNYNYYYNNCYSYYNNYYNYYYVAALCKMSGRVAHHEFGYRSERIYPDTLVLLTPKEGLDDNSQKFLEDFNNKVIQTAKLYGCKTINHVDFK